MYTDVDIPLHLQVGPVSHGDDDKTSPETRRLIDDEIKRILKVHSTLSDDAETTWV